MEKTTKKSKRKKMRRGSTVLYHQPKRAGQVESAEGDTVVVPVLKGTNEEATGEKSKHKRLSSEMYVLCSNDLFLFSAAAEDVRRLGDHRARVGDAVRPRDLDLSILHKKKNFSQIHIDSETSVCDRYPSVFFCLFCR